jgi:hypothetical protein
MSDPSLWELPGRYFSHSVDYGISSLVDYITHSKVTPKLRLKVAVDGDVSRRHFESEFLLTRVVICEFE